MAGCGPMRRRQVTLIDLGRWLLALAGIAAMLAAVAWLVRSGYVDATTGHDRPHGHQDVSFDVSPDGTTLVFNGAGQGGWDLYLLHLKSGRVRRLAETPDYE